MAEEGEKHPEHVHEDHEKKEEHPEKEEKHHAHEKKENHDKGSEKEAAKQLPAPSEKREKAEQKKEGASAPSGQHPPSSEKRDLRDSRISILLFTLAGIAMALLSSILHSSGLSNWITVPAGLVTLMALASLMARLFKRKLKFFYAGLFVYVFVWLVAWIFLYNM